MITRFLVALSLVAGVTVVPTATQAQTLPERAVRRDIPLTNGIRRAFAAGTRDSTGRPGANYWQLRVDYTIQARLDPATSMVTGSEMVLIHNTSDTPLSSIQLRLDQNIYAANVPRLETVPEITSGMPITRMVLDGKPVDLNPPPRRFRRGAQPPEPTLAAYGLDLTSARIQLPQPIAPGASAALEIDWSFEVPDTDGGRGIRMGAFPDSLFQVAQWYPRVAVFDDLRGWDTEPYLGPSEFYNNFGRFDVTIDVPGGWIVGATGVLQNPDEVLSALARGRLTDVLASDSVRTIVGADERGPGNATASGDRLQWHFVAEMVNDFAWATSDRYVWQATRATIPERGPVPIHILHLPGNATRYTEVGPVVRHALEFYSDLWMPYAFPQLTVTDGPELGMEYPMLIMSGLGAADHEVGHEWWPMMVGVNETWYGFMDEGFTVYMGSLSGAHRDGEAPNLDGMGQAYGRVSGSETEAPLMWNANHGGPMYGFQAYQKAPLMLSMLGGIVGDTAVWDAMSAYAKAWLFKHPSPWDYAFFMSDALGRDLGWFWYYWLFTTESVDGSIAAVSTEGPTTTVTVRQDGQMPSPIVLEVRFAPEGPPVTPMAGSTMLDSTTARVTIPADVWFPGSRTYDVELTFGARPIDLVILDPDCRFPDGDPTDNMWPRDEAFAETVRSGGAMMMMRGGAACYGKDGS